MATFKFGRDINIHWNGYDIKGPADTVFSIPDQLYEEFEGDLRGAEPTLTWIDTNEFLTLQNSVSVTTLDGTFPIASTSTTSGRNISIVSTSASDGYVLTANGTGGVAWEPLPGDATGITNIIGTSPISAAVSGTQATISIDQTLITAATSAANAQTVRTYVKNTSGTTIAFGKAVYVSGATGDNALISLSTASTEVGSSKTLGITAESIANDAFGYVVESGYLTGINTTGVSAGSSVWLGNTPGSLVYGAPPAEPSHSVYLGVVIREQQNNGSILVKVQNGYELDELHDVSAASPSDGDIIQYKTTSGLWTKSSIVAAGIAPSVHTHNYQASGNYQTAGTYVNSVVGTSPASVSTTSGTSTVSIIASSINSTHIADNAIVSSKIAAGAVGSAAIAANAVVAGDIAANAVTSGNIAAGAVGSAAIADNAIVAAKIAAGAVGTAKINSELATSGQVLSANGSGGATFATILSSAFIPLSSTSHTLLNGSLSTVLYGNQTASVSNTFPSIALDKTNNIAWIIQGLNSIRKIDMSNNSVLSTISIASVSGGEKFIDLAFGSSKLIAVTGSTVGLLRSRYFVIDPSAMTVQNEGNIKGASHLLTAEGWPTVDFDGQYGQFTIFVGTTSNTAGTIAADNQARINFRVVHPSTYSTRVWQPSDSVSTRPMRSYLTSGTTQRTHPVWFGGISRWVIGTTNGQVGLYSDSNSSTGFAALTGSHNGLPLTNGICDIKINSSTNSSLTYITTATDGTQNVSTSIDAVFTSSIVAAANTTLTANTQGSSSDTATYGLSTGSYGYGLTGDIDLLEYGGNTYVAFGGDVWDGSNLSKDPVPTYGGNDLGLTGTGSSSSTRATGTAIRHGNCTKIYFDGTSVSVLHGRNSGGVHIRKSTLGEPLDYYPYGISNTTGYILGSSNTYKSLTGSFGSETEKNDIGTLEKYGSNGSSTYAFEKTIKYVAASSGAVRRATPNFSGSNAVIVWEGWTIK